MSEIKLVRIYDHDQPSGYRILVDRLWPRGMSKIKANLDEWAKEVAPSRDLRKWFNHEVAKYPAFKEKYLAEIKENPAWPAFQKLVREKLEQEDVLFLYGAKDAEHNQAVILKELFK